MFAQMAKKSWGLPFAMAIAACLVSVPQSARADSAVVVLGVRSLDGDDALAHRTSLALRAAAKHVSAWKVSSRDVSLAQMSLAHGCVELDARCLANIAGTLEVDRLIYGTMSHAGNEVQISLFNFDAVTGQVESSVNHKAHADEFAEPVLATHMTTLIKRLAGDKVPSMLRVVGDAPDAEVLLDGKPAGKLDPGGELLIAEVSPGSHELVVKTPDAQERLTIEVAEATTATANVRLHEPAPVVVAPVPVPPPVAKAPEEPALEQEPQTTVVEAPEVESPEDKKRRRRIIGWSSVGLSGAFAVATVVSWVRLDRINDDPSLQSYRRLYPPAGEEGGTSDVCREAGRGTKQNDPRYAALERTAYDLCQRADVLEILQYVFLGSAILSGGVGTYLLLTEPRGTRQVSVLPRFGQSRASLDASFRF